MNTTKQNELTAAEKDLIISAIESKLFLIKELNLEPREHLVAALEKIITKLQPNRGVTS